MKKIFLIIFLGFLFCGNAAAAPKDRKIKLDQLFKQLKKSSTASESFQIELRIWNIWTTHPNKKQFTRLLERGSNLMSQRKLEQSYKIFSNLIRSAPDWAEAWNKRATVLYLMGRYQESLDDIDEVLKLESRHFGALTGQGLVLIKLKDYQKAIESYQSAQRVYPLIRSAELMIPRLKKLIEIKFI